MIKAVSRKKSLVDAVVERLRNVIARGKLSPGARFPTESELVRKLQVSRPVLREAVSRMEAMGLLTVQRGRGMFVGDQQSIANCMQMVRSAFALSPKDLGQFLEFRRAVECRAARRAAELATPEDIAELDSLLEAMDRQDLDESEVIRFDFQFHLKLAEIIGNELMRNVMEVIQEYILASMVQTIGLPHPKVSSYHRPILDAIRARNPEVAERAMEEHMDIVESRLAMVEQKRKQEIELSEAS